MFKETHPIVGTRDMRRAIAFYTEKLGFKLAFGAEGGGEPDAEHPNYVGYRRDAVDLHMQFQYPHEMGTIRLRLLVEDPDALYAEYRQRGVECNADGVQDKPWGTREFALYDPDRNALTFYSRRSPARPTAERLEIVIGSGAMSRIVIRPLVRGDEHWIESDVAVKAGAFRGDFRASLQPEELTAFRGDLERLQRDLRGVGRFDSMERQVAIEVRGDGRGHFKGSGRLRDRVGDGNLLECDVEFDQTDIPAMLQQLADIEAAFPSA